MLQFDPQSYIHWKDENIDTISIEFISSGCEGTSIQVHQNIIPEGYITIQNKDISIKTYCSPQYEEILENSYITNSQGKWIIKSEKILTRCGCGKSFGLKTGNIRLDKIKTLTSKLAKNKGNHK